MKKNSPLFYLAIFIIIVFVSDLLPGTFNAWYYGIRYNEIRQEKGIQTIPIHWEYKKTSSNYIFWHPSKKKSNNYYLGKEIKINFFSICSEKDTYANRDARQGKQQLSITQYYDIDSFEIRYYTFLDSEQPKEETLSRSEARKKLSTWR